MTITVRHLLEAGELRRADTAVAGCQQTLDRAVLGLHVGGPPPADRPLEGCAVVLSGRDRPAGPSVAALQAIALAGASVLVLTAAGQHLPAAALDLAATFRLPVLVPARDIDPMQLVQELHALIVDDQRRYLEDADRIHRLFTDLGARGASPSEVLRHVADLTGRAVILENLAHQVLNYASVDVQPDRLLVDWEKRSRLCHSDSHYATTTTTANERFLLAAVGTVAEIWGRVVVLYPLDANPTQRDLLIVERASALLATNRLAVRGHETPELRSHRTLFRKILRQEYSSAAQVYARSKALGVPLQNSRLVVVVAQVAPKPPGGDRAAARRLHRDLGERIALSARRASTVALVSSLGAGAVAALVAVQERRDEKDMLDQIATEIHKLTFQAAPGQDVTIGVGSTVTDLRHVPNSFSEATQIVEAAVVAPAGKLYFRLPDVRIRGLIHLLRDDVRLQVFCERELGPLLAYDSQRPHAALLDTLTAYLKCGYNKSAAADALGISRPAMYHRLSKVERLLSVDLEAPESRISLHVAVLGLECLRTSRPSFLEPGDEPRSGWQWMFDRAVEAG